MTFKPTTKKKKQQPSLERAKRATTFFARKADYKLDALAVVVVAVASVDALVVAAAADVVVDVFDAVVVAAAFSSPLIVKMAA